LYLEVFYFSAGHRRWFLGILIGLVVIAQAVTPSLYLLKGGKDLLPLLSVAGYNGEFIAALGLLIYSDREVVHVAVAVATLAALGYTLSVGVGPIGEVGAATRGRPLGRDRSNREYVLPESTSWIPVSGEEPGEAEMQTGGVRTVGTRWVVRQPHSERTPPTRRGSWALRWNRAFPIEGTWGFGPELTAPLRTGGFPSILWNDESAPAALSSWTGVDRVSSSPRLRPWPFLPPAQGFVLGHVLCAGCSLDVSRMPWPKPHTKLGLPDRGQFGRTA
jgi:hypothetical protein